MSCITAGARGRPLHQQFDIQLPDSGLDELQTIEGGKVGNILAISGLHRGIGARAALLQGISCFLADLKTAGADAWAYTCQNVFDLGACIQHALYRMHGDTLSCASPAGMHSSNKPACRIGQQDGGAVGYANGNRAAIVAQQNVGFLTVHAAGSIA